MRIRLFLGGDPDNNKIPELTIDMLRTELAKDTAIDLTDENPDIVHIVGAWTPSAVSVAKDALKKFIPMIHTPLASLSPWQKPTSSHVKLTSRCTTIVASGQMEKELLDDGSQRTIRNILNPVVTKQTSPIQMAEEYKDVYRKAIKTGDDELWESVVRKVSMIRESDEVILHICKHLLYAQCLAQRKNIPMIFLSGLAGLLTKSNYDEDRLGEVLRLIRLYLFTQRLEFLMQEKAGLTEGFMPVPMKDDKAAQAMLALVTDYKK